MRSEVLFLATAAVLAATLYFSAPTATAVDPVGTSLDPALLDLEKQQATLAANQIEIDTRIATIAEDVRVARIFVSRGGKK